MRVVVLRGTSYRRALWEAGTNCQLVGGSVVYTLSVVEGMCGAQVGEAFQEVKGYPPFSRVRYAWYSECVGAADVADDGFVVVREGDNVSGGDDVVYAYEGGPVAVRDDR